jgi:hypothetical protein
MSESPAALRWATEVQEPEIHPRRALLREWRQDREFVAAHDALEHEVTVASAVIKARGDADKTQEGVAMAMGTTQAVVAHTWRAADHAFDKHTERFDKATRTRSRIRFES